MMHQILKQRIADLNDEESGVVLVTTITVFLFLFLMLASVAVVGDTVRQRIMLQGAVDRAAYSGAAAQSEIISRVAVLNRALSWSYVQQNKLQMDYIGKQWLMASVATYNTQELFFENFTRYTTCDHPWHSDRLQNAVPWYPFRLDRGVWGTWLAGPYALYAITLHAQDRNANYLEMLLSYQLSVSRGFYVGADGQDRQINISGTTVSAETLRDELRANAFQWGMGDYLDLLGGNYTGNAQWFANYFAQMNITPDAAWSAWLQALSGHGYIASDVYHYSDPLIAQIDLLRQQIRSTNAIIADYTNPVNNQTRIQNAIRDSWAADPAWETQRNVDFTIYGNYDYFEPLVNGTGSQIKNLSLAEREVQFLRFSERSLDPETGVARMGMGAGRWWVVNPASGGSGVRGFSRHYNSADPLVARLEGRGAAYAPVGNGLCAPVIDTGVLQSSVTAGDSGCVRINWSAYGATHTAPGGDVSPCPMVLRDDFFHKGGIVVGAKQPVRNLLTSMLHLSGIFAALDTEGQSDMWCVAAARAGVNTTGGAGVYEATWITDPALITHPGFRPGGNWNLCNSDWSAVILPLDKIGCGGNDRVWASPGYDRLEVDQLLARLSAMINNGQNSLAEANAMLTSQKNLLTAANSRLAGYQSNYSNDLNALNGQLNTQNTIKTNADKDRTTYTNKVAANNSELSGCWSTYNSYVSLGNVYSTAGNYAAAAQWYAAATNYYNGVITPKTAERDNNQRLADAAATQSQTAANQISALNTQKNNVSTYYGNLINGENANLARVQSEIARLNALIADYDNEQKNNRALHDYYQSMADSFIWGSDVLNQIKNQLQPRYDGGNFDDLHYRNNNYLVH